MLHHSYKRAIKILLTTSVIGTFVFGIFNPFYVIYVQKLGGTIQQAGASLAAFSVACGVLILAFSSLESSVKNKRLLYATGTLVRAIAFTFYIFIGSYFELILVQILLGISLAMTNPTFDSLFTKWTNNDDALSDWSGWEGFTGISIGLASFIGGYVVEHYGFEVVFAFMALASLLTSIYLFCLSDETL